MKVVYNTNGFGLRLTETEMKMFCALLGYKLCTHPRCGATSDNTWFAGVDWLEFRSNPLLVRLVENEMLSNQDLAVLEFDDYEWELNTDWKTYERVSVVGDYPTCWGCGDDLEYGEDCYCGYCQPELETEGESK